MNSSLWVRVKGRVGQRSLGAGHVKPVAAKSDRRRACCHAVQGQGCQERQAAVFWDLDNIRPESIEHTLVATHRLCRAVGQLTVGPPRLAAYANQATLARLGKGDATLLHTAFQLLPARLVSVKTRNESADFAMRSDMYRFVEEHGDQGACLACMSNDQGFAPIMRYAVSQGCYTVCITSPPRRAPARVATTYNMGRKRLISAACHMTLLWSLGSANAQPLDPAECELLDRWQDTGRSQRVSERGQGSVPREVMPPVVGQVDTTGFPPPQQGNRGLNTDSSWPAQEQQFPGSVVDVWCNPSLPIPARLGKAAAGAMRQDSD